MTLPTRRHFVLACLAFLLAEGVSLVAFHSSQFELFSLIIIAIGLIWLAWKRPFLLALISIGEIVVGGKGYLVYANIAGMTVSLRYLLFFVVLVASIPHLRRLWTEVRLRMLTLPLLLFISWLIIGVLIGVLQGHGLGNIFTDSNAFAYVALLPCWYVLLRTRTDWPRLVLAVLFAGATILSVKSWIVVLLFGKNVSFLPTLYTWIRHTGIGEITYINNNIYRVFFQSHIYSLLVLLVLLVLWVRKQWQPWFLVPLLFSGLGVYVSLSRSVWLGGSIALVALIGLLLRRRAWSNLLRLWILFPAALFAWAMMIWAISWPYFSLNGSGQVISSRFTTSGASDAATARQNQIQPLLRAISHHPVIGSGFGKDVTYLSTDPSHRGWRTTIAFELGYLDLWLKIGAVGVFLYGWWLVSLRRQLRGSHWSDPLLISGVALLAVHSTTPYINHPLGLAWFMLAALLAYAPE